MSIVFDLERTNQLNLLPDKDLVDLCPPIEPYQVTKNHFLETIAKALEPASKLAQACQKALPIILGILGF
ncbi:hypothetical protein IQ224_08040 [Microcystis sp. LEGE 00066]|uniref:Uncharacterized protein n=1 Tax=Microcystis aeruginosa PCC 7806SL TaxID=1903187 RepID=A0AB33C570_MICA7|nr:hypothetical protein [Microcystis sp. LEGE 00066]ARI83331.1 hypothetical protein BH695_4052 [Microcystis aeruginosa PCC 7806SL]MBE9262163.1 hypothetical protein [Microcystis sp. LEGE 00066]